MTIKAISIEADVDIISCTDHVIAKAYRCPVTIIFGNEDKLLIEWGYVPSPMKGLRLYELEIPKRVIYFGQLDETHYYHEAHRLELVGRLEYEQSGVSTEISI